MGHIRTGWFCIGALVGLRLLTEYLKPAVFGYATLLLGVAALGQGLVVNPLMQAVLRYYQILHRPAGFRNCTQ